MKKNREIMKYRLNNDFPNVIVANGTELVIYRENLLLKKKIKSLSEEVRQLKEIVDNLKKNRDF